MSFRNGEAIVMRDVNDHIEGNTDTRCGLKARAELYIRKYYRQIIIIVFLLCAITIFVILVNWQRSKRMTPLEHESTHDNNGVLEEKMSSRFT